jgi:hypothetical protein
MRNLIAVVIAVIGVVGILTPRLQTRFPDSVLTGTILALVCVALVALAVGLWARSPIGWISGLMALFLGAAYTIVKTGELLIQFEVPANIRVIFISITTFASLGLCAFWASLWKRARHHFQSETSPD